MATQHLRDDDKCPKTFEQMRFCLQILGSFFSQSSFPSSNSISNKNDLWLDSNRGSLVSKVTALPTVHKPLSHWEKIFPGQLGNRHKGGKLAERSKTHNEILENSSTEKVTTRCLKFTMSPVQHKHKLYSLLPFNLKWWGHQADHRVT